MNKIIQIWEESNCEERAEALEELVKRYGTQLLRFVELCEEEQ